MIGLLALAFLAATMPATQQSAAVRVEVVDELGKPLAGATVVVETADGRHNHDADVGSADIPPYQVPNSWMTVTALAPGHCGAWVTWSFAKGYPEYAAPASFRFALRRGVRLSGIVRNEAGQPVPDAEVGIFSAAADNPRGVLPAGQVMHGVWRAIVRTDQAGRWTFDSAPENPGEQYIRPAHPDYFRDESLTRLDDKAARAGTFAAVLTRGRAVGGKVTSSIDGKPVAGAIVQCGNTINHENPRTITGPDGSFNFPHATTNSASLLVRANGFAPSLIDVPAGSVRDLSIALAEPKKLRGRVVDESGQPIPDAKITLDGLREHSRLYVQEWFSKPLGADGRFEFDVADDVAHVTPWATGYSTSSGETVRPGETEHVIVLKRSDHISGTVIDAATGEPIRNFRVCTATNDPDYATEWSVAKPDARDGKYDVALSQAFKTNRVRIEAAGYMPINSDVLKRVDGRYVFDARLAPAPDLKGKVLAASGALIVGARVLVVTKSSGYVMIGGDLTNHNGGYYNETKTDAKGDFRVSPECEAFDLLVLHQSGYARLTCEQFEASSAIHITPWSQIEGTIRNSDGAPLSGVGVFAQDEFGQLGHVRIEYSPAAKSDRDGRFLFEHVPATRHTIIRSVPRSDDASAGDHCKVVTTSPGQTTTLDFGGERSQEVAGRVIVPNDLPKEWKILRPRLTRIDDPNHPPGANQAWSPETQWTAGASENHHFNVRPDGGFQIATVEPGDYLLVIEATIPSPGGYCGAPEVVAEYSANVTVKDQPIDLGSITLNKTARIDIGDVAPQIAATTLDGNDFRLSDLRGKYVLIDFWATWCAPCLAETPFLKKVRDEFSADPRFVMVSLSADADRAAPLRYAQANDLRWPQALIGAFNDSPVLRDYHVRGIPSIWLIGPDGKVIAKNLRGDGIANMVRKSLQPANANTR